MVAEGVGRLTHVAIIGAGPAGLAAAACLGERGVAYTLLDRGGTIAAALRKVDPDMKLFSPARLSRLPGMTLAPRYPTFAQLITALERYRAEKKLGDVVTSHVTSVEHTAQGFVVHGSGPDVAATHVISATGIAANPARPDVPTSIPTLHSLDVRRAHIAASRKLLVVGAGASAADVLEQWLAIRQPGDQAWIHVRSKLRAMPSHVLGIDCHYLVWPFEFLPGRFGPAHDPMWGRAVPRAIKRGDIQRADVARYHERSVELAGGTQIEPDLIVFATGFRHDTSHLGELVERDPAGWPVAKRCETRTPNLYVLGSRYARSIASSYLRGISRDARYIASRIARVAA